MPSAKAPTGRSPLGSSRPVWFGPALLVVAIICFSLHNNLATLSYRYGVDVATVLVGRTYLILLALGIIFGVTQTSPILRGRVFWGAVLLSMSYTAQSFTLLKSFSLLPLSLAILIFYLFPIFVALLAAMFGDERLTLIKIAGALVAFGGLALALNIGSSLGDLSPFGLLMAFLSAVFLALNIFGSARLMRKASSFSVTFNMLGWAGICFTVLMIVDGGPKFPSSLEGMLVYLAAIVTSPIALISFYGALPYTGGPKAAMIMNGEPPLTIMVAFLLLGERLAPIQGVGALLVIGAIFYVSMTEARRARRPAVQPGPSDGTNNPRK